MGTRFLLVLAALASLSPDIALAQESGGVVMPPQAGGPAQSAVSTSDAAFGAYQRGYYITALREAMRALSINPKDAAAMTLIGELYHAGAGVNQDPAEARHWYKLAAELGDRQARFAFGMALLMGEGGAKDRAAAAALFEQAAAQGHAGALYNLGVMAMEGDDKTKPDFAKAAGLFKRAAELGDGDAAYSYGLLVRSGRGVPLDTEEGASWIKKSADAGIVAGEVEYAIMLFNGEGVDRDEVAAAKMFGKAAAQNNPIAQNRLAHLYATGRGLKQDLAQAAAWNMLATAAGVKDAQLDALTAQLTPQERAAALETVRRQTMF